MADKNIDIAIRAKNEASGAIREVKADIAGLANAGAGGGGLGALLMGGVAGFAVSGGIDMITGALQQAASAVLDLSQKGLALDAVRSSFDQLAASAGQSGDAILQSLRAASGGTVADMDLMLSANKAMMLGVADTAEEMTALLDIARQRGRAMGMDVTQAFSDIVTGLGRESALILDNLGIVIDSQKAFDDYAKTIGTTGDALDSVQRKQALVNAVMEQSAGGGGADNAANAFSRLGASVANLQGAVGQWINENTALIGSMNALAGAVQGVNDALNASRKQEAQSEMFAVGDSITGLMDAMQKSQSVIDLIESGLVKGTSEQVSAARMNIDQIGASLDSLVEKYNHAAQIAGAPLIDAGAIRRGEIAFIDAGAAAQQLAADQATAAAAAAQHEAAANRVAASLAALAAQSDVTGAALKSAWLAAAGALGASQALAGFNASQKELAALSQEWQYMGLTAEEIEFRKAALIQDTTEDISIQRQKIEDLTKATAGHAGAVAQVSKEYSDLQSKVSGVLSGALDVGVGVKAADLLPRENAVNENARRLAAIAVEGLIDQPWLEDFKREAPEAWSDLMEQVAAGVDVKTAAALILKDFEDGLRPDLMSKEEAKERVKRMILGEQKMSELAGEIATELAAEMKIPLDQAMAAAGKALGVPVPGAAGEAASDAAGATGEAGTFAVKVVPDTTALTEFVPPPLAPLAIVLAPTIDTEALYSSGGQAGTQWGAGFMGSASGALIVAGIVAKIAADLPRFKDSGSSAGTQWGAGFMGTVETGIARPLITLLATLVTPEVQAAILTGQSQTTPP